MGIPARSGRERGACQPAAPVPPSAFVQDAHDPLSAARPRLRLSERLAATLLLATAAVVMAFLAVPGSPPELPGEVVEGTRARYIEAHRRITEVDE